jgi:putative FmdB family regulatory protein
MPTYDYVCRACEAKFERFQKMSDGLLRKCPECGKLKLKRLMGTGAGIIFKGSGFYETDYKRKSSGNGKPSKPSVPTPQTESKPEKAGTAENTADKKSEN